MFLEAFWRSIKTAPHLDLPLWPIKQWELRHKQLHFVLEENRNQTCPKPSSEAKAQFSKKSNKELLELKKAQAEAKTKKKRRRRRTTNESKMKKPPAVTKASGKKEKKQPLTKRKCKDKWNIRAMMTTMDCHFATVRRGLNAGNFKQPKLTCMD